MLTMRIAALTLLFVTSTASLLSAAPVREENAERVSYSGKSAKPRVQAPAEPGWIELASETPASHGREFIEVDAGAGALTQLRLTARSGRPGIRAVRVEYKDGSHKVFEVDKSLGAARGPAIVDLRGARAVIQVIVVTDRTSPGSYVLEGNVADHIATR